MKFKQFDVWLADLSPTVGTEPGKTRPVVIIQTDLLNDTHLSTIVCPVTIKVKPQADILRVHLSPSQLPQQSDVLVDQLRAIDNRRFVKYLGTLTTEQRTKLKENLRIVLDL